MSRLASGLGYSAKRGRLPAAGGVRRRSPSSHPILLLTLSGIFLIALVIATIALILSNLRDRAIVEAKQQLLTTATVLAKQAARDFQALELVETGLIERMETFAIVSDELYARGMAGHDI